MNQKNMTNAKGKRQQMHSKMTQVLILSDFRFIDFGVAILTMLHEIKESMHKMSKNKKSQQINRKYKTEQN